MAHHALGRGAQRDPFEKRAMLTAGHNQIDALLACVKNDLFGRVTMPHDFRDPALLARLFGHPLAELLANLFG